MSCRTLSSLLFCALTFAGAITGIASGQSVANPPSFDFVTIGAVNNPAYQGTPGDPVAAANAGLIGRGSVGYEYALARTELTHAQYVPFINVLATRPGNSVSALMAGMPGLQTGPSVMGMLTDLSYTGPGRRFRVGRGAENWPVIGMSWRLAAMYCNWMHNGMQDDPQSMTSGAYDISTFNVPNSSLRWTDQLTKSPGARFWIPTLDEWIKGAHYDPNRNGQGEGGYWLYPTSRDTAPLPGLPSVGGQFFSGISEANPVGMYPAFASPWGLLDTAGSGSEWTETTTLIPNGDYFVRFVEGGDNTSSSSARLDGRGLLLPFEQGGYSTLRIATIPSPAGGVVLLFFSISMSRTRRLSA